MHFLIIAHDGQDERALERRLAAREQHLASITRLKAEGKALYGTALTDETGAMRGSVLIMNYETREDFDKYLSGEPYVTGNVWQQIEVKPCRVPDLFLVK
jgi:uncharacterized protein